MSEKLWGFKLYRCALAVIIPLSFAHARAETFASRMDQSSWMVNSSVFQCSLAQEIPFFGEAVFARRAGEKPIFFLREKSKRLQTGEALIKSVSPIWKSQPGQAVSLGKVAVGQGRVPVSLGWRKSEQLLAELHGGHEIELVREPWYEEPDPVVVKISNINFRGAYDKYLNCLGGLLPVNYDQVERTSIYFPAGATEGLSARARRQLQDIVTYAKADKKVVAFYIDGHTDSQGARAENLALSQKRAEEVKSYLANRGIDPQKIAVRWHGERYPVASNRTAKGRALNRRVTIRLDKTPLPVEAPEVQPMVAAPSSVRNI